MRSKEAIRIRILQLCEAYNMTLTALSTISGTSQSTISNIVTGRNNSATVATIQKICDGLGMDLPSFFDSDLFRNLEQEIV